MSQGEVEKYIEESPEEIRDILRYVRAVIKQAAPEATEKISWGMPAYSLNGGLVFFAAQKRHLGFYPAPSGVEAFKDLLRDYKITKGGIQFPYSKPIPFDLIAKIVEFRVKENLNKKKKL